MPKDKLEGMRAAQFVAAHNSAIACYRCKKFGEINNERRVYYNCTGDSEKCQRKPADYRREHNEAIKRPKVDAKRQTAARLFH